MRGILVTKFRMLFSRTDAYSVDEARRRVGASSLVSRLVFSSFQVFNLERVSFRFEKREVVGRKIESRVTAIFFISLFHFHFVIQKTLSLTIAASIAIT